MLIDEGFGDNHTQVVEVEAYATPPSNFALATNGATTSASTTYGTQVAANVINGDHKGLNSGWWTDNTSSAYPDWVEVDFWGTQTINEIDVFGLQQNPSSPVEPTLALTSSYALTSFEVQYWTGTAWATVTGASVSGNDKVWRKFTFASLTTSKIRVNVTNVSGDNHTQVVEVEAWGPSTESASSAANINWLVSDQLGTPRMIFDQTGSLATTKRHDYAPFGEELFNGARTAAMGYASNDTTRQKFTQKERDTETGLDYFGARYYLSTQGRFIGVDPYDVNLERQDREDQREAEREFFRYISQPQHWNHYSYVLNNPLKFVDPDGWSEDENKFHVTLLGQDVTVVLDKKIMKQDPNAIAAVKEAITKAVDKIKQANKDKPFTQEQVSSIQRVHTIQVTPNKTGAEGMVANTFYLQFNHASNPNIDILSGDIMHDARHGEQMARGLSYNNENMVPMEMEASSFVSEIIESRGWGAGSIDSFRTDAAKGHVAKGMNDKSTPETKRKVFDRMRPRTK